MAQGNDTDSGNQKVMFEVDEVLEIKGAKFKVTLFDAYTANVVVKLISNEEAESLLLSAQQNK